MPRNKDTCVKYFRFEGKEYSVSGDSPEDAMANKTLKIAALKAGREEITNNTLVKNWVKDWMETYKHNGSINEQAYKDIKSMCNNYIVSEIGMLRIRNVKPIQLQKIVNKNVKSKSFNDKLYNNIKQIFRTAYHNRLTGYNIAESLEHAATVKSIPRRSITEHEREILLRVLDSDFTKKISEAYDTPHRGKLFCYLMLYAGLRPGEAAALLWKDIDLKKRKININKALKADGIIKPQPKSNAGFRDIPIQDTLYDTLTECQRDPFEYVCVNSKGNRYTKKTIFDMWGNIRRLMDIEMGAKLYRHKIQVHALPDDFYLYDLRHTFCTDLQSAGVAINVARELMGHEDISIT